MIERLRRTILNRKGSVREHEELQPLTQFSARHKLGASCKLGASFELCWCGWDAIPPRHPLDRTPAR